LATRWNPPSRRTRGFPPQSRDRSAHRVHGVRYPPPWFPRPPCRHDFSRMD